MRFERLKMAFNAAKDHIVPIIDDTVKDMKEIFEKVDAYIENNTGVSVLGRPAMIRKPVLARVPVRQHRQ